MNKGFLLIVSGPSGAGKGTICERVLQERDDMSYSISCTTRKPRMGEVHGENYFFVSTEEFKRKIENNELLEHALVHDFYYGTPIDFVHSEINRGNVVLLEIDVQGAKQINDDMVKTVRVFIAPPSMDELKKRLLNRGKDDLEIIEKRLKNAEIEMDAIANYDYLIINDKIEESVDALNSIVTAEQHRIKRRMQ